MRTFCCCHSEDGSHGNNLNAFHCSSQIRSHWITFAEQEEIGNLSPVAHLERVFVKDGILQTRLGDRVAPGS
jgi:hypothetical protein